MSKVNAVKFQTIRPENLVASVDKKKVRYVKKVSVYKLTDPSFIKISENKGLIFFSTPFDLESTIFLNKIQSIFKIASGDNNFFSLIDKIFEFKS